MNRHRFETRDTFWFVGLGGVGPYFKPDRPEENWVVPLWEELFRRQHELPAHVNRRTYISPCHGREREFTFYGGFASQGPVDSLPSGMIAFQIPTHVYAVGSVNGERSEINRVYSELPEWAAQRQRPVNRSILWLEVYPRKPVLNRDGPFQFDVWLPVD